MQVGKQLVHVNQDTLLNYGVLDLGTAANQAIFRIQNHVEKVKHWMLL
jgi:aspartyl/asparaginyl-tRNA synthetase